MLYSNSSEYLWKPVGEGNNAREITKILECIAGNLKSRIDSKMMEKENWKTLIEDISVKPILVHYGQVFWQTTAMEWSVSLMIYIARHHLKQQKLLADKDVQLCERRPAKSSVLNIIEPLL